MGKWDGRQGWIRPLLTRRADYSQLRGQIRANKLSDHCPVMIEEEEYVSTPTNFKLCDMWVRDARFQEMVIACWRTQWLGSPSYMLVSKLRT